MLAEIWTSVLAVPHPGIDDDFFELGGDSISAFRMIASAHARGIRVTIAQLMAHPTIAGLASVAIRSAPSGSDVTASYGPLEPTPIACWLRERGADVFDRYTQAVILETRPGVRADHLRASFHALVEHHDALRIRWAIGTENLRAWIAPPGAETAAEHFEHRVGQAFARPARDAASFLQELDPAPPGALGSISEAATVVQKTVRLTRNRIAKAVYFETPGGPGRLLLCLHHVAVDGVSWRILLEDLDRAYGQVRLGEAIVLPDKTTSFRQWSQQIAASAGPAELAGGREYWEALSVSDVPVLRRDGPRPKANTVASTRTVSVSLTREETYAFVRRSPKVHRAEVEALLLAALARTFESWNGTSSLFVNVEGHGRDVLEGDIDVSRTVGWFTIHWPLLLEFAGAGSQPELVRRIQRQYRDGRERRGSFFLLRYLGAPKTRDALKRVPHPEVRLNYLGGFDRVLSEDSVFRLTRESPGPSCGPEGTRSSVFDVFGSILDGRLRFDWGFSANLHRPSTVEILTQRFAAELRELIVSSPKAVGAEPQAADFPLAKIDQAALDRLLARAGKGNSN